MHGVRPPKYAFVYPIQMKTQEHYEKRCLARNDGHKLLSG